MITIGGVTLNLEYINTLWKEEPWFLVSAIIFVAVMAVILTPRTFEFVNWLSNRRRRSVVQINTWLDDCSDLSPEMRESLYAERERLMFLTIRGISANNLVRKALTNVSEDKLHDGVIWDDLRLARDHLSVDKNSELIIRLEKGTRVDVVLNSIVAFCTLLLSLISLLLPLSSFVFAPTGTATGISGVLTYLASIPTTLAFVFMTVFFAIPITKFRAAQRVEERLKQLRVSD